MLLVLLQGLEQSFNRPPPGALSAAAAAGGAVSVNELLFGLALDNINLFQLVRWMREHKMVQKVGCTGAATDHVLFKASRDCDRQSEIVSGLAGISIPAKCVC
jgi:hypothetical protein